MPQTNPKTRKIIVVCGKTGYGKSYLVKNQIALQFKRIIIFDVMSEYEFKNFLYINDVEDFREFLIDNADKEDMKVILRLPDMESYEFAFRLCKIAQEESVLPLAVIIEEIWNFASPHYYTKSLEDLIRFGRHFNISLVGISQRISDVGPLLLNNADMLICFNLTDKNDILRLSSISYVGEEGARKVSQLGRYKFEYFENS